jgi:predicted dinucleotide-binding enzyme
MGIAVIGAGDVGGTMGTGWASRGMRSSLSSETPPIPSSRSSWLACAATFIPRE